MHISKLDLNLFKVFDAIVREGGISAAARALNLTQPAVSHALGRLRDALDDPLFRREGRAMVPTPLARGLIEPVRDALRRFETTLREIDRFDPASAKRRFTVAMRASIEEQLVPPLTARLRAQAPGVDLTSTPADRRDLAAELADGTLDAAIDIARPMGPEIRRLALRADRLIVVARAGHPGVGRRIDLETYLSAEHIRVSLRRQQPGLEDQALAKLGLERRIRLRCQNHSTACRIVSESDLLLTMAERYARILNAPYRNRIVAAPVEFAPVEAYLYWHDSATRDPANAWLRGLIADELASQRRR